MKNEVEKKAPSVSDNFFVVGVGASSGGLDAFKLFIKNIPVDSGMAFVLVQHLDPHHDSILVDILQKFTKVPVHEITDNIQLEADHIYVIPSNKLLTVTDGNLNLEDRSTDVNDNIHAIDLFLTSLAEIYQAQAIGVLLSGAGTDGTRGLGSVKKYGGLTLAQAPASASYPSMPQSAIDANVVDFELAPEEMIKTVLGFQHSILKGIPKEPLPELKEDQVFYSKILSLFEARKGVDFTYYKQTTVRRRIARRMVLKNISKVDDYLNHLAENEEEVDLLFQDLLIPVTDFFRDPKVFQFLHETALPALMKSKGTNESLRIWSVGCSTGQEAYSLAMLLHEFFELASKRPKIQIFATDISEVAIMRARAGLYSANDVSTVSQQRLEKFFTKTESGYHINKSIRDICVFAAHNILTNPPFAGIDLVSCRNMLIYMDGFLQRKAMATFHYSLNEKGMLLLGRSESSGSSSDLFSSFSEHDKVYTRNLVPGRYVHIATKRRAEFLSNGNGKALKDIRPKDDFQKNAQDVILAKSPDGVIINDRFEIVHFRGTTGNWIEPAEGKPSLNILKMVKRELAMELRSLIHKAKTTKQVTKKEGIVMQLPASKKLVTIEVIPLLETINVYFLILFEDILQTFIPIGGNDNGAGTQLSPSEVRSQQLEKELLQIQEDMRVISEDQETGNEELLSANEELLSGSEELRSLNEELEISKEELESTVEELSVSNQELAFRINELNYSRIYSEAIVTTITQPLVVLDNEMKIKSANPAFYQTCERTQKEAEGKFFYEINNGQWDIPGLRETLKRSLEETNFLETLEVKVSSASLGVRMMILNVKRIFREGSAEQLVLIVIEDVTDRRRLEHSLEEKAEFLRGVLESSPQISSTATADGRTNYFNNYFLNYAGVTYEEAIESGWESAMHPDDFFETTEAWKNSVAAGEEFEKEVRLKRHDGVYRWHISRALPTWSADGKITSWVGTATDIHEQKMFAEELERKVRRRTRSLKQSNTELQHSNRNLEQFAFIASHDLQEPLRKILMFSGMLVENFTNDLPANAGALISKISASSKRMSSLIHDVLNFSRIDTSSHAFENTDLNTILSNVLTDFSLLIEEKKAHVRVGQLPFATVIPFQINQLFYNLISNSLKFSRTDGFPEINITSRSLSAFQMVKYPSLDKGRSYLEIVVEDNGIGFDQKYGEKIFEIFQRLHDGRSYPGTGIGLALCKKIVTHHNGEISAESEEGVGTLFRIILPLEHHVVPGKLLPGE